MLLVVEEEVEMACVGILPASVVGVGLERIPWSVSGVARSEDFLGEP